MLLFEFEFEHGPHTYIHTYVKTIGPRDSKVSTYMYLHTYVHMYIHRINLYGLITWDKSNNFIFKINTFAYRKVNLIFTEHAPQ